LLITIYESRNFPLGTHRVSDLPSIFASTAEKALAGGASRNIVVEFDGELTLAADAAALGSWFRGPVGLDIGAVTPESIALAIVSEIHAWLAGRQVQFCSI
jgi:hypothetical protein